MNFRIIASACAFLGRSTRIFRCFQQESYLLLFGLQLHFDSPEQSESPQHSLPLPLNLWAPLRNIIEHGLYIDERSMQRPSKEGSDTMLKTVIAVKKFVEATECYEQNFLCIDCIQLFSVVSSRKLDFKNRSRNSEEKGIIN